MKSMHTSSISKLHYLFFASLIMQVQAFALNFQFPGTQNIVITNASNEATHIRQITLSPSDVSGVNISSSNCETIPVNSTCSISLSVWSQASPGYASVIVTYQDNSQASYGITVEGTHLKLAGVPAGQKIRLSHNLSPERLRLTNVGQFDTGHIHIEMRSGLYLPLSKNNCEHNILFPGSSCEFSANTKAAGQSAQGKIDVYTTSGVFLAEWPVEVN